MTTSDHLPSFHLATLDELFTSAEDYYAALKAATEGRVRQWEWASGARHSIEPAWFERHDRVPAAALDRQPERVEEGWRHYGFDEKGRLVVERHYVGVVYPEGRAFQESFYFQDGDDTYVFHFRPTPENRPISVSRARRVGDRVTILSRRAAQGVSTEKFVYEGDRLTRIDCFRSLEESSDVPQSTLVFEYDAAGRIAQIEKRARSWAPTIVFRQKLHAPRPELVDVAAVAFAEAIHSRVTRLAVVEPVYAIIIAYHIERPREFVDPLPAVMLATTRRAADDEGDWHRYVMKTSANLPAHLPPEMRERALDRGKWSDGRKMDMWNPAESRLFDVPELDLAELRAQWASLPDALQEPAEESWRQFFVRVARILNSRSWASMRVTDDFVVVPSDLHQADEIRNFRESVARERLELLVERGWLPGSVLGSSPCSE